ncbi:MAG: aminoacyl-tRNA hydrolase [Clostridia bacterium]|nr:aminoacyl-tRNA hydrolase [Clostridia bacterium]MBR5460564.1 aminoacyl-tRNA hydrolase [Clostridia bacterium]
MKLFNNKTYTYIVAGLGNPGKEYVFTRHNAGYLALDYILEKIGVGSGKVKFHSACFDGEIEGQRILFMKPQTYMNDSGLAIGEAAKFYNIPPENVIVIFDDISLVPGKIRLRRKGSHGGHNGIKSITAHLNSSDFPRIKIGVGSPPHPDYDMKDWVLGRFPKSDEKLMFDAFTNTHAALCEMLREGIDTAMCHYN